MKKNIILAAAWMVLCIGRLAAQEAIQANAAIAKQFESSFQGAQNVRWTGLQKEITQAQFHHSGTSWVAYYDQLGNLIASGRRIKTLQDLPLVVQQSFLKAKAREEKKSGSFMQCTIFEMVKDINTDYIFMMDNPQATVTITVSSGGAAYIAKKTPKSRAPHAPKNVLARRPQ